MNLLSTIGNALRDVVGILPFLQTLIINVEHLFGGGGGGSKLDAVVGGLDAVLQSYAQLNGTKLPANVQGLLSEAVNANVALLNAMGLLLPHTAAPAA